MDILFPIGRLISGSVSEFSDNKDDNGQPKFDTDGKKVQSIWFRVAIPKTKARWQDEVFEHPVTHLPNPWGQQICDIAKAEDQTLWQLPTYAWKITDGDSPLPDKNGKIINSKPHFAGNWVIQFAQSSKVSKPTLCTADGLAELPGEKFKCGYYVQVFASVKSNKPSKSPGLYVNPKAVALAGIGDIIEQSVDTTSVGFGGGVLPAGASAAPAAEAAFGASAAPATPVVPNTAFMTPPAPGAAPAAPRAPVKTMTAKANGATYEQFKADPAWTDELMVAQGYLVIS